MIYRFDTFQLDTRTLELREGELLVPIQRKVFDVLLYLVEHRDRVVWKDELLREIWPNETVVESAVHRAVSLLRRTLRQTDKNTPLETIYGRGYRFRAVVQLEGDATSAAPRPQPAQLESGPPRGSTDEGDIFVGRTEVLRPLLQGLSKTSRNEGSMFLLVGEAGIGKSRLAERVWRQAEQRGARLWKAYCSDISGAPTAWPWIQILRDSLAELGADTELAEQGRRLLTALSPQRDGTSGFPPSREATAAAKFRLFDELCGFLIDACRASATPHVVWIDDLAPSAIDSFHILDLLGTALHRVPLLILVTLRSSPAAPGGAPFDRVPDTMQRIAIPPLSRAEVAAYVARVTELPNAELLAARIFEKSEGNPLFVRELLHHLLVTHDRDTLSDAHARELSLPTAIHEIIDRQLQQLAPDLRSVLEVAAVSGREFRMPLFERCAPVHGAALLAVLDRAVQAGLLRRDATGRSYRFAQELLRDTVYRSLDADRAAALHATIAEALEGHVTDTAELCSMAFHYLRSLPKGDPRKAVRYAVEAAQSMMRSGAYEDAVRYSHWALEAQAYLDSVEPGRRCELLELAAINENAAGNIPAARKLLSDVVDIASRHSLGRHLAVAGLTLRPIMTAHHLEPDALARRALDGACTHLPEHAHSIRARVTSRLAWLPPYSYDRDRRLALCEEAAALASKGNEHAKFDVMVARQVACSAPEDLERAREATLEMLDSVRSQPLSLWTVKAHKLAVYTYLRLGENDRAAHEIFELGRTAREMQLHALTWLHDYLDLQASFYDGDLERVERGLPELYARGKRLQIHLASRYAHALQSRVQRETDRSIEPPVPYPADLPPLAQSPALDQARAVRDLAESTDPNAALTPLSRLARSHFKDLPHDGTLLATLAELALAIVALGRAEHAHELLGRMQPYRHMVALDEFAFSLGALGYYSGILHALVGERDAALADLEAALELNQRLGHRPQTARTRLAIGEILLDTDDAGSRRRGLELLRSVASSPESSGLQVVESRARRRIERQT